MTTPDPVHVAVGVIRDGEQRVLVARRAAHLHQGGLWEFPGGKVEAGETVQQALARELREELAIEVVSSTPLLHIHHAYPDKQVWLDVHEVHVFRGEPRGLQQQPLAWVSVAELVQREFPQANRPIITALRMPRCMLVTGDWVDVRDFERRLASALARGVRLVQLRAHHCDEQAYRQLFQRAKILCDASGALLIANTTAARFAGLSSAGLTAAGLHLSSAEFARCVERPVARDILFGTSCHSLEQLQQAMCIGVDYVVLGSVAETRTHPEVAPLGFSQFGELASQVAVPVYAVGGMSPRMLDTVIAHSGYGIAAIRSWWDFPPSA